MSSTTQQLQHSPNRRIKSMSFDWVLHIKVIYFLCVRLPGASSHTGEAYDRRGATRNQTVRQQGEIAISVSLTSSLQAACARVSSSLGGSCNDRMRLFARHDGAPSWPSYILDAQIDRDSYLKHIEFCRAVRDILPKSNSAPKTIKFICWIFEILCGILRNLPLITPLSKATDTLMSKDRKIKKSIYYFSMKRCSKPYRFCCSR